MTEKVALCSGIGARECTEATRREKIVAGPND
jgi:hypothetical protein